jgi:hypothetical protein
MSVDLVLASNTFRALLINGPPAHIWTLSAHNAGQSTV